MPRKPHTHHYIYKTMTTDGQLNRKIRKNEPIPSLWKRGRPNVSV